MSLTATVRARVDTELKTEVEEILSELGLSMSQAIVLFLKAIQREGGIPMELKISDSARELKNPKNHQETF